MLVIDGHQCFSMCSTTRSVPVKWLTNGAERELYIVSVMSRIEDDVKALLDELPNGERPAQHAHVRVHAHHDHVLDAPFLHQVDGLGAVGDRVGRLDLQRRDLVGPGAALLAGGIAIAAAVGIVDRQTAFALAIDAAALFEQALVATCGARRARSRCAVPS